MFSLINDQMYHHRAIKNEMDWLNCQKWAIQIGLNRRKYEF